MPLPFYHICLAGALAEKHSSVQESGDFFLGNIAPDAVLSRPECTLSEKFRTHLRENRERWRNDVMSSFEKSDKNDFFTLGYHMHLVTDIFFRDNWEAAFLHAKIPENMWDTLAYHAASLGIRRILETGDVCTQSYEAWIRQTREYQNRIFPFGMTGTDMEAEIDFAANISAYTGIEMKKKCTELADFMEIYRSAIPYLDGIFGVYLET